MNFETIQEETDELPLGETRVSQEGVNGYTNVTYTITYEDGVEIKREESNREVIPPVNKVVEIGTFEEPEPDPDPEG